MMKTQPNCHYGDMFQRDEYVRQRYQKYQQFLIPYFQPKIKVLDVGGYRGELKSILPANLDYYVLDFDQKALNEAKKRGAKVKKINFDEQEISWDREKFDIIVATEVLEHLKDPTRHLLEIKRLLKDDGIFLVSLPNENMFYHRLMSLFGLGVDYFAFKPFKHLHLPTISQSKKFLESQFDIVRQDYYINVGAQSSRLEFLGGFLKLIPDFFWEFLARLWPSGFARGTVFLLKKF